NRMSLFIRCGLSLVSPAAKECARPRGQSTFHANLERLQPYRSLERRDKDELLTKKRSGRSAALVRPMRLLMEVGPRSDRNFFNPGFWAMKSEEPASQRSLPFNSRPMPSA